MRRYKSEEICILSVFSAINMTMAGMLEVHGISTSRVI